MTFYLKRAIVLASFYTSVLLLMGCSPSSEPDRYISIYDSRVFVTDQGDGPAILFIHGGLMDQSMWREQVDYFSKSFRVVTLDLRGHGKTSTGKTPYVQADAIRQVLDSLHIAAPHIVAHSLGAIVALDFVRSYPGRTSKLVLIGPGLYGFDLSHDSLLQKYSKEFASAYSSADTTAFIETFIKAWYDGHLSKEDIDQRKREVIKSIVTASMKVNQWKNGPVFSDSVVSSEHVKKIKNETLVIAGDQVMEDILMIADTLATKITNAKKLIIRGATHMVPYTSSKETNDAIEKFLN